MIKKISFVLLAGVFFISCKKNTDYIVTIHTSFGDMKAILYNETPLHKENFLRLVRDGKYDSTIFHRVIKGFMIQGGDVDAKEKTKSSARINAEIVEGLYHTKGSLAAARQGDNVNPEKRSSWCQFYIVHGNKFTDQQLEQISVDQNALNRAINQMVQYDSHAGLRDQLLELQRVGDHAGMRKLFNDNIDLAEKETNIKIRKKSLSPEQVELYKTIGGAPHLDGDYTVFGKIVEGLDVVDKIAKQRTGSRDKPVEDIFMNLEIEEVKRKEITEKYGYIYPEED